MSSMLQTRRPDGKNIGSFLRRRGLKSATDKNLQDFFKRVERKQKESKYLDPSLRNALGLPTNKVRNFLSKCLYRITPQRFYGVLPESIFELMAEENDVLAWHASKLRERLNDTQLTVKNISGVSKITKEEADQLKADIETATADNWNSQRLQEFIAEAVDVEIYPEVAQLLDDQFWGLSPEKQEKRRERSLAMLRRIQAAQSKASEYLHDEVCEEAMQALNILMEEYYCFMKICIPVAAVRDAAKALLGTNVAMFTAKDAVRETMRISGEILEIVADGLKLAQGDYSLSAPDMSETQEFERNRIRRKLKELESSTISTFRGALAPKEEIIEVKATEVRAGSAS